MECQRRSPAVGLYAILISLAIAIFALHSKAHFLLGSERYPETPRYLRPLLADGSLGGMRGLWPDAEYLEEARIDEHGEAGEDTLSERQALNFAMPTPFEQEDNVTYLGRWAWGGCSDVEVDGDYAYIRNGGLMQVLDITDPEVPRVLGEYETEINVVDIEICDSYAYLSVGKGLEIIDVRDPSQPVEVYLKGVEI